MQTNITPPSWRLVPDELIEANNTLPYSWSANYLLFRGMGSFVITTISQEDDYTVAHYNLLEYWIVAPDEEYIEVYYNQEKQIQMIQKATKGDSITSEAIDGFVLEVDKVFG